MHLLKNRKLKPLLAKQTEVEKYIKIIDKNRYYSNYGPLYSHCKSRIIKDLNLKKNSITLTSSGYSSLYACCLLLKQIKKKKKYIIVPSFSFYANPQSIIQAGFEPYFIDINLKDYTIDLDLLFRTLKRIKNEVAAIMFVSPFGYPLDIKKLNQIKKKFNIEIIYDAADTFINLNKKDTDSSNIFICCSFHPTKNLPANESGLIIASKKNSLILKNILNFGYIEKNKKRNVMYPGFNGKFSEYDAAIFLANYNKKNYIKKKIMIINQKIIKTISNKKNFNTIDGQGTKWVSNKILIVYKEKEKLINYLSKKKIQTYIPWSDKFMHEQFFFKKYKCTKLENTKSLAKVYFALYLNLDITNRNVKNIIKSLKNFKN